MDISLRRRCLSTKLSFRALAQMRQRDGDKGVISMLTIILYVENADRYSILIAPNQSNA